MMIDFALFDIDGVLTDGTIYVDSEGNETKRISFDDIDAIFELKRAGIKIGFITGEDSKFSEFVKKRFSPDFFAGACKNKLNRFKKLTKEENIDKSRTCFVGDSKKDIPLLRYVGHSFCPSDVDEEIKDSAKKVLNAERGRGVIKEAAKVILNGRG